MDWEGKCDSGGGDGGDFDVTLVLLAGAVEDWEDEHGSGGGDGDSFDGTLVRSAISTVD